MTEQPIGLHTICYAPGMTATVDPDFLPFDVSAEPQPERRETAHMLTFWRQGRHRDFKVSALLSPKFTQKTAIDGAIFNAFILNNPNYDVWFVNPYPHYFYLAYNIWEHGEIWYPGLSGGHPGSLPQPASRSTWSAFPEAPRNTLLFSNIWAGTAHSGTSSWRSSATSHATRKPFRTCSIAVPYEDGRAVYFPFIFERLFTTFLVLHRGIRARYANFQTAHILDMTGKIDRLLIREWGPLIDKWDRAGAYTDDQRAIFRGIQKLSILGMHGNNPEALHALLGL